MWRTVSFDAKKGCLILFILVLLFWLNGKLSYVNRIKPHCLEDCIDDCFSLLCGSVISLVNRRLFQGCGRENISFFVQYFTHAVRCFGRKYTKKLLFRVIVYFQVVLILFQEADWCTAFHMKTRFCSQASKFIFLCKAVH